MKLKLFLMSAMLVLTLGSFGQDNSSDLQRKYNTYLDICNKSNINPISYQEWVVAIDINYTTPSVVSNVDSTIYADTLSDNISADSVGILLRQYNTYLRGRNGVVLTYNDWVTEKYERFVRNNGATSFQDYLFIMERRDENRRAFWNGMAEAAVIGLAEGLSEPHYYYHSYRGYHYHNHYYHYHRR
jgi:hypothetical protein